MVRYITLAILLIICILAMISRKYYSKYKALKNPFWCLADMITENLPGQWKSKVSESVRRTDTYNVQKLKEKTDDWLIKLVYKILMMTVLLVALTFVLTFAPEAKEDSQKLKRPGVGGLSNHEEIELLDKANNKKESCLKKKKKKKKALSLRFIQESTQRRNLKRRPSSLRRR